MSWILAHLGYTGFQQFVGLGTNNGQEHINFILRWNIVGGEEGIHAVSIIHE